MNGVKDKCKFGTQNFPETVYPCGFIEGMNTLSDFKGNRLSSEFAYQCYKFLKVEREITHVYAHNKGGKAGAISYTKGAFYAGFTSFKTDCMTTWMPIPSKQDDEVEWIVDKDKLLSCITTGDCDTKVSIPTAEAIDCHNSDDFVNVHLFYANKRETDRDGDEFEEHVDDSDGTEAKFWTNKRTRRSSWTDPKKHMLESNEKN